MPAERESGSVKVELDGAHLRVDARPARLVSQLRGGDGEPVVTAQPHGGDGLTETVPAAARQVTMRVSDELTVEATRAADFVALADKESGRRLVVAFTGEVTVLPKGAGGDRFALSAHEALLVPAGGGDPRVVPLAELSDEEQGEITSAVEAASLAVVAPAAEKVTPEPVKAAAEPKPAEPKPAEADDATTGDIVPGETKRPAATGAPSKTPPTEPKVGAGAGGGGGRPGDARRGKKGKKGRPQPAPATKAAPLVPAAAAAGGAAAAASAAKKGAPPIKKATTAPAKKATSGGPGKGSGGGSNRGGGGGGGRGGGDDSYADTPGDRRFVLGAIGLAALLAIVLAVFVFTGDDGDQVATGTGDTTTTSGAADTTAATTTAPAGATTTAPAAATTTARPAATTTAKPAVAASWAIDPKTCVQNGNSITYTANLTNKAAATFDFTVRVVFKDAGGVAVASSDAAVNKVGANKSVDFTATGTSPKNLANTGASCNVERVDARPSGS